MAHEFAVSVVIPTYNDEKFIGTALASVFGQTYQDWEIVIVDDGSTDGTVEIARSFGERVKIFQQPNSGSAVARNRGIQEARASYVAFLDADDFWLPEKLNAQMKYLTAHPEADFVYCAWKEWYWPQVNEPSVVADVLPGGEYVSAIDSNGSGWLYPRLLLECFIQTSTVLIRKSFLEKVGAFDVSLRRGQDYDLWLRCAQASQIVKIDYVGSLYRLRNDSITKRVHPINYGGIVLEKAVKQWGMQDARTEFVSPASIREHISIVWRNFALEQAGARQHRAAGSAIFRALRWWPLNLRTWVCLARVAIAPFRPRSVVNR